jgi:hypothetical protein
MPQQPAVIGRLEKTVIDSPDPRTLAAFSCQVLDMRVNEDTYGWVVIGSEPGLRQLLLPGRETLPSNGLQQLQFGIVVRGPDVLDPATPTRGVHDLHRRRPRRRLHRPQIRDTRPLSATSSPQRRLQAQARH